MFTVTRKSTLKNGNARVWIEGKDLIKFGIKRNDRFDRQILAEGQIILKFNPDGKYKVSGKAGDIPVIDLTGAYLNPFLLGSKFYNVSFIKASELPETNQDVIAIKRSA